MISPSVFACALCILAASTPVAAAELPFFAESAAPQAASQPGANLPGPDSAVLDDSTKKNPWAGLTIGSEVFGVSGMGKGSRGGFGGAGFIGYNHEFDNKFVLGVQGSAGYLPGLTKFGPKGYNFAMADVKLGYDMGRFMPYVTVGVGQASVANGFRGAPNGLDSLNDAFAHSPQSVTLTRVGAGFDYAVTDHITVGASISTVQAHGGGYGAPMQPGSAGLP